MEDARQRLEHNNNNNGFKVRFGVQRRHRGPPLALGYHQFIIGGNPGPRGRRSGYTDRVGNFHVSVRGLRSLWWEKMCF
jgi:hypothetical protein